MDPKAVGHYVHQTGARYPVQVHFEDVEGMAIGSTVVNGTRYPVVRWRGEEEEKGYPVGPGGTPLWMELPPRFLPYLLQIGLDFISEEVNLQAGKASGSPREENDEIHE